ncbi:hypothetical protein CN378_17770 [Bacillus sp. AFS015802]|uniref:hypothetical protein n=1 Tax=Bacillus sp. AFS015802 TaxID=2033486 RepID=UPI000BFAB080|nr:hypothetical protein [Bacillus sp. AFS015802]PFA62888.1 hypothetical protein CN378_17770 [Bacillus sp. AFS015802]
MKYIASLMIVILVLIASGCQSERDEQNYLSGESSSWKSTIQVTFTHSGKHEKYYIGGNLSFKKDYTPSTVKYYLTYPNGEGSGTARGKEIKIPQGGGTRGYMNTSIESFLKDITLMIEWENEEGDQLKEEVPLDKK